MTTVLRLLDLLDVGVADLNAVLQRELHISGRIAGGGGGGGGGQSQHQQHAFATSDEYALAVAVEGGGAVATAATAAAGGGSGGLCGLVAAVCACRAAIATAAVDFTSGGRLGSGDVAKQLHVDVSGGGGCRCKIGGGGSGGRGELLRLCLRLRQWSLHEAAVVHNDSACAVWRRGEQRSPWVNAAVEHPAAQVDGRFGRATQHIPHLHAHVQARGEKAIAAPVPRHHRHGTHVCQHVARHSTRSEVPHHDAPIDAAAREQRAVAVERRARRVAIVERVPNHLREVALVRR
mmetsp:Transcript_33732/g.82757  ORF Transcript_33732/g.82757 Transcript_33732/m.82757 type:complete len:291 (+) Transcript_33732:613-1485(+)